MCVVIDIGNSNTTFGVWDNGQISNRIDIPTREILDRDWSAVNSFLETSGTPASIGIASVVPNATESMLAFLKTVAPSVRPSVVTYKDIPLVIHYDTPATLGIDRLLVSYAAHELYAKPEGLPVLVVDFGSATTYNCVSIGGEFLGGCITLGIGSTLRALHELTAQLPMTKMELPENILARSTEESLRAGVLVHAIGGMASLIMLYTLEAFEEVRPILVVTGGYGGFLERAEAEMDLFDPDLLLKGIGLLMERIPA